MMSFGKIGARRTARILLYDAEVEYLESTGTQWIDTGIQNDTHVKMNFKIRPSSTSGAYFMGVDAGLVFGTNNGVNFRANGVSSTNAFNTNTFYAIEMYYNGNQRICVIDGSETLSNTLAKMIDTNILLFAARDSNGIAYYLPWSISECKMWSGSTLVRDFVPVRFTNELGQSEGAMFDRANPTVGMNRDGTQRNDGLYRNRGTGTFVIGPDI